MWQRLRRHWPEYAIEAWALATFMVSAGVFTLLIEHPDFGVPALVESVAVRRVLIGVAMGITAIALIYSPWGRRSGAQMNPALTVTFLALGRMHRVDAACYVAAQFLGGLLGVLLMLALFGDRFSAPPVQFVATLPTRGASIAFMGEALISFLLVTTVLALQARPRLAPFTGLVAGVLVAAFIAVEAPYSGMSMNPARSLASALPAGLWGDLWIYFAAPLFGMGAAAAVYRWAARRTDRGCAKYFHARDVRCIHCGYEPAACSSTVLIEESMRC
jgi:aquaporin Z